MPPLADSSDRVEVANKLSFLPPPSLFRCHIEFASSLNTFITPLEHYQDSQFPPAWTIFTTRTMSDNIEELLVKLRDNPADNSSATEQVLARVFKHLNTAPEDSNGRTHWFCSQAQPSIVGSASFLLRLYGFNGDSVNIWKAGFRRCITNCCSCAQQLEEIKMSSRSTYVSAESKLRP